MILSLTLDEENSERLMLKYYVFLLKAGISDPVATVRQYRGFVDSYLQTVEDIEKNEWRFKPKIVDAGTVNSPAVRYGIAGEFFVINIFNYTYGLAHINNGIILCVDDIILMQIEITAVICIYWLWRLIDVYNIPHN